MKRRLQTISSSRSLLLQSDRARRLLSLIFCWDVEMSSLSENIQGAVSSISGSATLVKAGYGESPQEKVNFSRIISRKATIENGSARANGTSITCRISKLQLPLLIRSPLWRCMGQEPSRDLTEVCKPATEHTYIKELGQCLSAWGQGRHPITPQPCIEKLTLPRAQCRDNRIWEVGEPSSPILSLAVNFPPRTMWLSPHRLQGWGGQPISSGAYLPPLGNYYCLDGEAFNPCRTGFPWPEIHREAALQEVWSQSPPYLKKKFKNRGKQLEHHPILFLISVEFRNSRSNRLTLSGNFGILIEVQDVPSGVPDPPLPFKEASGVVDDQIVPASFKAGALRYEPDGLNGNAKRRQMQQGNYPDRSVLSSQVLSWPSKST